MNPTKYRVIGFFWLLIILMGCSGDGAKELYEIALLEERQNNIPHAIQLYQEIVDRHEDSDYADKARTRLNQLKTRSSPNMGETSMTTTSPNDYSKFDRPEILQFVFHPRPEPSDFQEPTSATELLIPVDADINIGARFYSAGTDAPVILFFHGNGEIVADYEDMASFYTKLLRINFFPVDYRGYGRSNGSPTITAMMNDCHKILDYALKWLKENGYNGALVVMGRSLGSVSALELAAHYQDRIDGLIIESGLAYTLPLLHLRNIDTDAYGLTEAQGYRNLEKISTFKKPTLVIHAEKDHLIPFSDGQALSDACPAAYNKLLKIPDADHNTIFAHGVQPYLEAVKNLVDAASQS